MTQIFKKELNYKFLVFFYYSNFEHSEINVEFLFHIPEKDVYDHMLK